ncbi:MAG: DUF2877 domain-containing protein [Candidatus Wallbacteria bacterium]|nr:DUF2877 domain-containing protein [Candidatus Wallbacteria bacterium]
MTTEIPRLKVENHLHLMLFSDRRYDCRVITRSSHAVYINLNGRSLFTLLSDSSAEPNPVTAVTGNEIPQFFMQNDNFRVSGGFFSYKQKLFEFQPELVIQKKISRIKIHNIVPTNLSTIEHWLKTHSEYGMSSFFQSEVTEFKKIIHPQLDQLASAFRRRHWNEFFKTLVSLSGCGPGLTPATDDFICGVLFTIHALECTSLPALRIIRETWKRTNRISWYYIVSSLFGYCSPWQLRILNELSSVLNQSTLDSIEFGHTSGSDFLFGVWFMLDLTR